MRRAMLSCILAVFLAATGAIPAFARITHVAPTNEGSANPTYFATQHRIAVTSKGRLLVIHGRHSRGVQVRWKNAGSSTWNTTTKGAVTDGMLLDGTGSGDWPSSIQVGKGPDGKQRAWVVMGDVNFVSKNPIRMRVLTGLDSAGGPTVGPLVVVDDAALGDAFVDLALERRPSRGLRGAIVFVRRVDQSTWKVVVKWFRNLGTTAPSFVGTHTILSSSSGRKQSTIVPTSRGLSLLVRGADGAITRYVHDRRKALTKWSRKGVGVRAVSKAKPTATGLSNGDVVMAVEDKVVAGHVTVQRFKPGGGVTTFLKMSGYSMPTIASNQRDVWIVMIRDSDGFVVSRHFSPLSGWGKIRVEVGSGQGGHYQWPNALRTSAGRLRFVVRAGASGSSRSGVIAVDRAARRVTP